MKLAGGRSGESEGSSGVAGWERDRDRDRAREIEDSWRKGDDEMSSL